MIPTAAPDVMKPPVKFQPFEAFAEVASLDFHLPANLEAGEPPEARGLRRDQVRLLVSMIREDRLVHDRFTNLADYLQPGDVLVVNTSGTLNAALNVTREDGTTLELHLSTHLPADLWSVELRLPSPAGSEPFYTAHPGERLRLPGSGSATLLTPYRPDLRESHAGAATDPEDQELRVRLWLAVLDLPEPLHPYLERYGFPIRYKYVRESWPNSYYQTVFVTEKGSAEMPSAARGFTPELVARLVSQGVQFAPLLLHTGVASLESHEPPYEEFYRVSPETARLVNAARQAGKLVICVGTTAVRALETVAGSDGLAYPRQGWTDLVVTPHRGLRLVDGLLTGLHEPRSSHLAMLAALAGFDHLRMAYTEAICEGYLWHEFGDLHLILP